MKHFKTLVAFAMISFLIMGCSQDNDSTENSFDYTAPIYQTANNQIPSEAFDNAENGIYFGVIASGIDQSRGKIWINVGNDGNYSAYAEMVGGKVLHFYLQEITAETQSNSIYLFSNSEGSFLLDLRNFNEPMVTSALFNNTSYFAALVKSRSHNRASSITATFEEFGNPAFGGTWNLVSDGSVTNPNGTNGEGITSLMITKGTQVFIDNSFESFNASYCLGISDLVPTLGANSVPNTVMSDYQTSLMAGGDVKWSIGFDPLAGDYIDWRWCEIIPSGTFRWTNPTSTLIKEGWIILDE